jgi:hypothetical protein
MLAVASLFVPTLMMSRETRADAPPKPQVYEVAPPEALGVLITEEVAPGVRDLVVIVSFSGSHKVGLVNVGHFQATGEWFLNYTVDPTSDPDLVREDTMYGDFVGMSFALEETYSIDGLIVPLAAANIAAGEFVGTAGFTRYTSQSGPALTLGTIVGSNDNSRNMLRALAEWAVNVSFADAEIRTTSGNDLALAFAIPLAVVVVLVGAAATGIIRGIVAWFSARERKLACLATSRTYWDNCNIYCINTRPGYCCYMCCKTQWRNNKDGCKISSQYVPVDNTLSDCSTRNP